VIVYLSTEQVLAIHRFQIRRYGGTLGVRDAGALESALTRPQMTFGGDDLYPDLSRKAGALLHSLVANHPFIDGNKRVGTQAMLVFLLANEGRLVCADSGLTETVLAVARGELEAEALAIWIGQRLVEREP
jgi:death-on-curing protein